MHGICLEKSLKAKLAIKRCKIYLKLAIKKVQVFILGNIKMFKRKILDEINKWKNSLNIKKRALVIKGF